MGLFDMREQLEQFVQQHMSFEGMVGVKEEFVDHLEDAVDHYIMLGYPKQKAIEMAMGDFGDINDIKEDVITLKTQDNGKKVQYAMWFCLGLFLVSFALTFKTSFRTPFYPYIDINPFRLVKIIALASLLLTISTFVWGRRLKKEKMCA
jgi:hypothetical protein